MMKNKINPKGLATMHKLVLIVVGVSVTAIIMMVIQQSINSTYAEALQTALG